MRRKSGRTFLSSSTGNYGENNDGHVTGAVRAERRHENNDDQDNDDERTERERLWHEQKRGQSPGRGVSKSNKTKRKCVHTEQ